MMKVLHEKSISLYCPMHAHREKASVNEEQFSLHLARLPKNMDASGSIDKFNLATDEVHNSEYSIVDILENDAITQDFVVSVQIESILLHNNSKAENKGNEPDRFELSDTHVRNHLSVCVGSEIVDAKAIGISKISVDSNLDVTSIGVQPCITASVIRIIAKDIVPSENKSLQTHTKGDVQGVKLGYFLKTEDGICIHVQRTESDKAISIAVLVDQIHHGKDLIPDLHKAVDRVGYYVLRSDIVETDGHQQATKVLQSNDDSSAREASSSTPSPDRAYDANSERDNSRKRVYQSSRVNKTRKAEDRFMIDEAHVAMHLSVNQN